MGTIAVYKQAAKKQNQNETQVLEISKSWMWRNTFYHVYYRVQMWMSSLHDVVYLAQLWMNAFYYVFCFVQALAFINLALMRL